MLERGVYVTTDRFEVTTPHPHFINDRCFGEDFAEWLRLTLLPRVVSISEPIQEDWGWALLAAHGGVVFTVAIGVMDASIGMVPAEWRIGVSYERSQNLRRLLSRAPVEAFEAFARIVRSAMERESDMRVSDEQSE